MRHNEDGATLIEYAVILAFVVLLMLAGMMALGGSTGNNLNATANTVGGIL